MVIKFIYFLIFFIYLNNIVYADFKPYMKVNDLYVKLLVRTFPSFDYIEYNTKYYEAIPSTDGIHILTYQFKNKQDMYKSIDKSYPTSDKVNIFDPNYVVGIKGFYKPYISEDYRNE